MRGELVTELLTYWFLCRYGNANVHSRTEQRDGYNVKGKDGKVTI